MAKQSAYDVGFLHGSTGQKQVSGRAYESEKANKAYFEGFADGLKKKHPGQMIVKCNREGTIFPAYPSTYGVDIQDGSDGQYITCPACARRYFHYPKEGPEQGIGTGWHSDRALKILYVPPTMEQRHENGMADAEASG